MKKTILFSFVFLLVFTSCRKRLDDFLFNPDNSISEYLLDEYTGPDELTFVPEFSIPDSLIHHFTMDLSDNGKTETIHAIYVGSLSKIATDSVILYCHGNAGNMDYYWNRQKLLANVGGKNKYGVLQIDYPGYGLSTGKPSEQNLYSSVGLAINWLKSQGLNNDRFFIYGFSLGSAPACEITAANNYGLQPSKIILESPFASAEVMIQDAAGLNMPSSYFVNLKIDNAEEIKEINQPLLWIHGTADDFLNIDTHGEVVFKNYSGTYGEAVRVAGGGHADVPFVQGYDNYMHTVLNFLRK
jgi:pimeloyl-ACP methyl ester carboxylesterase